MNSKIEAPTATYRFQLRQKTYTDPGVTFADVVEQIPYLKKLGISHVYFSPIFTPVEGSEHCYDGINYHEINPAIGGEEDFKSAVSALHNAGIKVIVDFVPNHMGTGTKNGQNRWWQDLLLNGHLLPNGRESKYVSHFDVFWGQHQDNRIVMAELGEPFSELIKKYNRNPHDGNYTKEGCEEDRDPECRIIMKDGKYFFDVWNDLFPINKAGTELLHNAGDLKTINHNWKLLEKVHDYQNYRLEYWLTGENKLNYRRFFAYRELAGLRIEDQQVFDDVHAGLAKWKDMIDGVRVDHIDGLRDPAAYLQKLRDLLGPDKYIVVEDILSAKEALPSAWLRRIQGTTGYDHLIAANRLFTRPSKELTQVYASFVGKEELPSYEEVLRQSRLAFVEVEMKPELQRLQNKLEEIAALAGKHFKKDDLRTALKEVTAAFPVYRTYITKDSIRQEDRDVIAKAVTRAKTHAGAVAPAIDFIADVLGQNIPAAAEQTLDFTMTYQQFSSPVVAKGTEDTAFYRYNLLRGAAEVGAELDQLGMKPAEFTHYLTTRIATTMNASSTHDTKLGEDTRARAIALSHIPKVWGDKANQWKKHLADAQVAGEVTPENQYLFLQTLVASYPIELLFDDAARSNPRTKTMAAENYAERIKNFMKKAMHEEKVNTGYSAKHGADYAPNNPSYEFGVELFIDRVLHDEAFMADFKPFARKVARMGANVSLAQRILQTTAPGVPDIYQGSEGWNLSLVDPDNRRTPDFAQLKQNLNLADNKGWETLSEHWPDGVVKQVLTQKLLHLRQDNKDLFGSNAPGELVPLEVHRADGSAAKDMVAFARVHEGKAIVVAVPVALNDDLYRQGDSALGIHRGRFKDNFEITLPPELQNKKFVDALCNNDNDAVTVTKDSLKLSKAFQYLPGVVLGSGLSTGATR